MKISLCPVAASVPTLKIVLTRICRSKTTAAKAGGVKQPQPLKRAHETLHISSEFRRSPRGSRCLRFAFSFPFLGRTRLPVRIRKCQRNRRRNLPLTEGILHHSPIAHQLTETRKEAPFMLLQCPHHGGETSLGSAQSVQNPLILLTSLFGFRPSQVKSQRIPVVVSEVGLLQQGLLIVGKGVHGQT